MKELMTFKKLTITILMLNKPINRIWEIGLGIVKNGPWYDFFKF